MPLSESSEKPLIAERAGRPIAVFSNSYARLPEHFSRDFLQRRSQSHA
jgi:hypothetical protein